MDECLYIYSSNSPTGVTDPSGLVSASLNKYLKARSSYSIVHHSVATVVSFGSFVNTLGPTLLGITLPRLNSLRLKLTCDCPPGDKLFELGISTIALTIEMKIAENLGSCAAIRC